MEPMLLEPAGKDYLWGGRRLKEKYGKQLDLEPLAEAWECSVHPDGLSRVASGRFSGESLRAVLEAHPAWLGEKTASVEEFPVLVKFIDSALPLSVQVHPDDEYAAAKEGQKGKTEMWYVLEAAEGASLICGFAHNMTREKLEHAIRTGAFARHLQKVRVKKGDVFFIPPGTVHAIGEGILLVEVQQNSNLTYRVHDYDRVDKNGKKRELHFGKALEVMKLESGADVRQKPRLVRYCPGCSREALCRCRYFEVEKLIIGKQADIEVNSLSFQALVCLEGEGEASGGGGAVRLGCGDTVFLPAGLGRCRLTGAMELLKVRC